MAKKAKAIGAQQTPEARQFLRGQECPQILKLSKHLEGRVDLSPGQPCQCECKTGLKPHKVFRAGYRAVLKFSPSKPCDETELEPLLQAGSELWLEGSLLLREDKCHEDGNLVLIGQDQGTFRVHRYRPNEDVVIGRYCGTQGVLPIERGPNRCCAPGHGWGNYCDKGIGKLTGWTFCASYHSVIPGLVSEEFCKPRSLEIMMDLDGVLIGPCQPIPVGQKSR